MTWINDHFFSPFFLFYSFLGNWKFCRSLWTLNESVCRCSLVNYEKTVNHRDRWVGLGVAQLLLSSRLHLFFVPKKKKTSFLVEALLVCGFSGGRGVQKDL